jgi:hypothetical protein
MPKLAEDMKSLRCMKMEELMERQKWRDSTKLPDRIKNLREAISFSQFMLRKSIKKSISTMT